MATTEKSLRVSDHEAAAPTANGHSEKEVFDTTTGTVGDVENGHLVDLEVDLSRVIGEDHGEGDWDENTSPFATVRAVVPETDDPDMPVNTVRAWFLGIVRALLSTRPNSGPAIFFFGGGGS